MNQAILQFGSESEFFRLVTLATLSLAVVTESGPKAGVLLEGPT